MSRFRSLASTKVLVPGTLVAVVTLAAGSFYLDPSSAEPKAAPAEPPPTPVPVATVR